MSEKTPAEILELQAQDAYQTFMRIAYGELHNEPWDKLPPYAREAWRAVIMRQQEARANEPKS